MFGLTGFLLPSEEVREFGDSDATVASYEETLLDDGGGVRLSSVRDSLTDTKHADRLKCGT